MRVFLIILTAVTVIFSSITVDAQVNPLTGKDEGIKVEYSQAVNKSKPQLMQTFIKTQKELSQGIAKSMRKIKDNESPYIIFFAIGIAFLYGVLHTIGPGHGKTLVISYFSTQKAKFVNAFLMGLQVAVTHVLSAIVIVFLANVTLRQVITDSISQVFWIKIASYLMIVLVGIILLISKIRGREHQCACHSKKQGLIAFAAGIVPCTGAMLILLFSMANEMLTTGLLLVSAIGAGIALTISVVGICTISACNLITTNFIKLPIFKEKNYKIFELFGALLIMFIGIAFLLLTIFS